MSAEPPDGVQGARVAFLGLGHMGLPMAQRLEAAGAEVATYDVVPEARDAAAAAGLRVAEDGLAAAGEADVVLTMFPDGRHVLEAYRGGLLSAAPTHTLFVDCSTIAVDDARAAHALARASGHRFIDAPVSGGVVGAESGTLAFMVGGAEEDVARARPLLDVMGRRVVHCGGPGLGQAAKVCNNMILGVTQIAVAEAFVLGERLGLTHEALFEVASNASGQCWALTTNCPVPGPVPTSPANHGYAPGFAGALMAKDLGLAARAIERTGVGARMGLAAGEIYKEFARGQGAGQDFSGIIHDVRARSSAARDAHAEEGT
jgi:3-hydroxyisobutyrate dehydrogenase